MTATEPCFKCGGDGGERLEDGWMPCFRCSASGRLPLGTLAEIERTRCDGCDGDGYVRGTTEDGFTFERRCDSCIDGRSIKVPEPKRLPCGHISHENGGPADYPTKCRGGRP